MAVQSDRQERRLYISILGFLRSPGPKCIKFWCQGQEKREECRSCSREPLERQWQGDVPTSTCFRYHMKMCHKYIHSPTHPNSSKHTHEHVHALSSFVIWKEGAEQEVASTRVQHDNCCCWTRQTLPTKPTKQHNSQRELLQ